MVMAYRFIGNVVRQYAMNRTPWRCSWYSPTIRHMCYDPDGKTIVHILNRQADKWLMVDSYSQVGFRLNNGLYILGPLAIFPRSVLSWNVAGLEDVNEDSLSLFLHLEPKLDILILGLGEDATNTKLNQTLFTVMAKYKINVEILTTDQACATFNFLNAENRYIAAALIPPTSLKVTDDDIAISKMRHKKLYGSEDYDEEVERRHIK